MGLELERYWGIGPKTREKFEDKLGVDGAQRAVLYSDFDSLLSTGVGLGRIVSILRRVGEGKNIDAFGSVDSRNGYKNILEIVQKFSVSSRVKNKIKILAPMSSIGLINEQLDLIFDTVEAWKLLPEENRKMILERLKWCDDVEGIGRTTVGISTFLYDMGNLGGVFQEIETLNIETLKKVERAMNQLKQTPLEVDAERIRPPIESIESLVQMEEEVYQIIEDIKKKNVSGFIEFKEEVYASLTRKTGIDGSLIRDIEVEELIEADEFILEIIRKLKTKFRGEIDEEKRKLDEENREFIERSRGDINKSIETIDKIAFYLSLALFALHFDMSKPIVKKDILCVKVKKGRNLSMLSSQREEVTPINYTIGTSETQPQVESERLAVLTGRAGSGKTTLLDTVFHITVLSNMGLPVPAEYAEVGLFDSIILQKCSGKQKIAEAREMLKSMVPPIVEEKKTLLLVDEIEMVTGMKDAPEILRWVLHLADRGESMGVFSTHIAKTIVPIEGGIRIEGIDKEQSGEEYQPMPNLIAKPTIELAIEEIIASTKRRSELVAYRELDIKFGERVFQRKLNDPKWKK
ncbi:MAG TPA: hypothetical protein HA275_04760 [Halobacteriales archaeon]|uniref:MutS-related protein n=1 Tax=Candidatus Hikarchaeum yamanae TaxID=2675326 RepID=UPI0017D668CF|nr:hypothetical protein [Halobacteriales archaeon]|tara:strand:- start:2102 stop:3832 length:1731 start_codon:yes stop_codon:yes gene_type:complete